MSLPRFMAAARVDDPERIVSLADELVAPEDKARFVCLVQCGPSVAAAELSRQLVKLGRHPVTVEVRDRAQAQSDAVLSKLAGASAVWIFADDLFDAFFTLFATQLAFALRTNAMNGLPIIGIGGGAIAMGGLLLAHRICGNALYDLASGLGWGQRVLIDAGVDRPTGDDSIVRESVRTLPGLLGVDLGAGGGIRVDGGRIESIGSETITLFGAGDRKGTLLMLPMRPGAVASIAPPPFAPFERGMLSQETLLGLAELRPDPKKAKAATPRLHSPPPAPPRVLQRGPPSPELVDAPSEDAEETAEAEGERMCPMCKQIHPASGPVDQLEGGPAL